MYKRGAATMPSLAILSALAYIYAAYFSQRPTVYSRLWGVRLAGVLTISVLPFTLLVMGKTNATLMSKAQELESLGVGVGYVEAGLVEGESVKELVDWWATLNAVRGSLPLVGAAVGIWSILG